MTIYDPIADALNLPPIQFDSNLVEGVDYFPWKYTPPCNKGVPVSEEQKQRQSVKMKGRKRSAEACAAISRGKTDKKRKPFSEETKRKISEAAKKQWENSRITGVAIGKKKSINSSSQ
jgi:hypothetical protein